MRRKAHLIHALGFNIWNAEENWEFSIRAGTRFVNSYNSSSWLIALKVYIMQYTAPLTEKCFQMDILRLGWIGKAHEW